MTISFNEIPYGFLRKGAYAEVRPNYQAKGVVNWPARALLIGQMLSTGSLGSGAAAGSASVAKPITRLTDATGFFGQGSQIEMMARAFKRANPYTELWAVGVADAAASVKATETITFSGTPTSAGTIPVYIAGFKIPVGYSITDTASTIATAVAAAVNADTRLPMTATSAAGVVTLTARNGGTNGNQIDVRIGWFYAFDDQSLNGITAVVAAGTVGATDPSISTVITALANDWYTDIVMPWTDATNMAALETELARRYAALGGLDAHAFTAVIGSYATSTTWSSARNSAFVSTLPIGPAPLDPPWVWASALAGVAADQATRDPARQLGSLTLPGIKAPAPAAQFLDSEQNLMLGKGLSSWDTDPSGNVTLNRVVTNYTKATTGAADTAWLDITVPRTASRIRYDWLNYVALNYPRHKLADDGGPSLNTVANAAPIVTPRSMLGSWIGRCRLYLEAGWIEDMEYSKTNSFFEREPSDRNRLNGRQSIKIIGNLMVLAGALEFQA